MIYHLISSPRNLSTAMMYSFHHRGDTLVVDEPFYGYYLKKTGTQQPGYEEIIQTMINDSADVIAGFGRNGRSKPHLFIKDMAHHLIDMDISFINEHTPIFLIRNPKQLIASFAQVIPNPKMEDVGLKRQYEIFQFLKEHGSKCIVVDSGDLIENIRPFMEELCTRLDLDFKESMISWPKGAIAEDGIWAKYWYKNIHQSTGFSKQKTSDRALPKNCEELYQESKIYYDELSKYALKV